MKKHSILFSGLLGLVVYLGALTALAEADSEENKEPLDEQLNECFAATLWNISGRSLNKGEVPEKTVKVPEGWKVVGGGVGGARGEAFMILCR
ncbi:hypothetical protein ACJJIE_21000 [Microbulbifer sp. TRSA001]|uniref:hypothetical protein n=1 Tax=Microbulbifer sp. TRSA001 TaxID=3243381 RepID=UPI0040393C97